LYWIIYVFSIFNLKNVDKILFFAYINFTLTTLYLKKCANIPRPL
jgi:hypothetical protein